MNLYRLKLNKLKSEMLYIASRVGSLKKRALEIQIEKVSNMTERLSLIHYEQNLISTSSSKRNN